MKDATDIIVVLDRSGSMRDIQYETESGFDVFIKKQLETPDETKVSLYQFDDKYDVVYENESLDKVPPLSLIPRGMTALLDAIGKTIQSRGEFYASLPEEERPERIMFVVITDGEENSSTEYTLEAIKSMVTLQQDVYKWQFVFLGADIDAMSAGQGMGFSRASSMSFSKQHVAATYSSLTSHASAYRGKAVSQVSFSDAERAEAMGEGSNSN